MSVVGLSDCNKKTWTDTLVLVIPFVVLVVLMASFFVSPVLSAFVFIALGAYLVWLCHERRVEEKPSFEQQLRSEFWVYMGYQNEGDENIYISKVFAGEKRYSQLPREDRDHRWRNFYLGARRFLRVVFSGWR